MKKIVCFRLVVILVLVQISFVSIVMGQEFTYNLGTRDVLTNQANVPIFPWFPDGHISVLAEPNNDRHIMYWSEFDNYRTSGAFPFPEYQYTLTSDKSIFGGRRTVEKWDNGGSWLMSVFRKEGDQLLGFYHAEDHWGRATNPQGIAWKSIARTTSNDNGLSWSDGEQIITSPRTKPESPAWGGAGDNCVIWDSKNNRWLCYYQEHWLMMAISYDGEGKPGTWFKYYNGEFSQPGLGGESSAIPELKSVPGANPSVHYNDYLERFVMVWHSWVSTSIYISTSIDGVNWEEPRLLEANSGARRAWYPTIIGESNTQAGKITRLYYADIAAGFSSRDFVSRALVFDKEEEYQTQTTWQHHRIGEVPILGLMDISDDDKLRIVTFDGSIDDTENIEYYYKDKEGAYIVSGKFLLDELYHQGAVGLSIRSGLNLDEAMAAITLSKGNLTFYSREKAGDLSLGEENAIEWESEVAWLQIEKSSGTLICRYSATGEDWTEVGRIPFAYGASKLGLFSTGSPDKRTIAYVENIEEKQVVTSTQDQFEDNRVSFFSNPAGDQVYLSNPEYYTRVSIYDLNGKLQLSGRIDSHYLDVQHLRPGMYVLSMHDQKHQRIISGKLVIAR